MITYKTVLIGDFATGKTSLVRRFVDNSFSEEYISSIGVSISKKSLEMELNGEQLQSTVMLWDIEGKTDFKPIFTHYLSGSKGFIVVGDLSRQKTIDTLKEHIEICNSIGNDLPICIALNKADIENVNVDIDAIYNISNNIICVEKTSAKNSEGVESLFQKLNYAIVEKIKC